MKELGKTFQAESITGATVLTEDKAGHSEARRAGQDGWNIAGTEENGRRSERERSRQVKVTWCPFVSRDEDLNFFLSSVESQ